MADFGRFEPGTPTGGTQNFAVNNALGTAIDIPNGVTITSLSFYANAASATSKFRVWGYARSAAQTGTGANLIDAPEVTGIGAGLNTVNLTTTYTNNTGATKTIYFGIDLIVAGVTIIKWNYDALEQPLFANAGSDVPPGTAPAFSSNSGQQSYFVSGSGGLNSKFLGTVGAAVNWGGTFMPVMKITGDGSALTDIIAQMSVVSVSAGVRAVLFTDNAGTPDKLKDWSNKLTIDYAGIKWFPLTQGYLLGNGTSYWIGLAYAVSSGQINIRADTSRTTAGYKVGSGADVTTARDSPVLDLTAAGGWGAVGATAMIWADGTNTVTFAAGQGSFTLAGGDAALTMRRAAGGGAFVVSGGSLLLRLRKVYLHPAAAEPLEHPRLQSIRVGAPSLSVFRKLSSD